MNGPGRSPGTWARAAAEFRRRHGNQLFTMTWNRTIETVMKDKNMATEPRFLSAVQRYAWGNLSDFAVDGMPAKTDNGPKPRPLTQDQIAEILGLTKSSASRACNFLKEHGYLRKNHVFLYPEDEISLLESTKDFGVNSNSCNSRSPNFRWEVYFFSKMRPDLGNKLSNFEAECKQLSEKTTNLRKEIKRLKVEALAARRDAERNGTLDLSLLQNDENTTEPEILANLDSSMGLCALAHNQSEGKANIKCISTESHSLGVSSNSTMTSNSNSEYAKFQTSATEEVPNPTVSRKNRRPLLKPLTVNSEGGTTTTISIPPEKRPSSSSPAPESFELIPLDWRQGLCKAFTESGKPLPVKAQIATAYVQVNGRWKEFLSWLPTADEFRRMAHPGGLPTLISFFLDTEPGQTPQRRAADRATESRARTLDVMNAIDQIKRRKRNVR